MTPPVALGDCQVSVLDSSSGRCDNPSHPTGYRKPNTPLTVAFVSRYTTVWLTQAAEAAARTYVPELAVGLSSGCCSDQQSFIEQGYPAMRHVPLFDLSLAVPL